MISNFHRKLKGIIERPLDYFNVLLDSKYSFINRTISFILFFIVRLIIEISKIFNIKNFYNKDNLLNIISYHNRYYGCFYSYCLSRKELLENKLNFKPKSNGIDSSFNIRFELSAYKENNIYLVNKNELFNHCIRSINKTDLKKVGNIFHNKKVLILGPSKVAQNLNYEEFDIFCIANHNPKEVFKKFKKYSGFQMKKIVLFCNIAYFNRNKLKLNNFQKKINSIIVKPPIKSKYLNFFSPSKLLVNDYGPMGLQNIIYTSFLGESKQIFVTGITGYIGKDSYREGIKSYSENFQHYTNNLRRHEPLSNFCFLKNFLSMGIVEGDHEFEKIFSLKAETYSKELDKTYGDLTYRPIFANFRSL